MGELTLYCSLNKTELRKISKNPFLSAKDLEATQRNRLGELLDWVVKKTELLRKLNVNLATTIRAWDRFAGDMCYFDDLNAHHVTSALTSLEKILESLVDLKRKLRALETSCKRAENMVSTRKGLTTSFLLNQFKVTLFIGTVGNKINAESQELSRRSHEVNLETAKLNRQGTAAAVESSRTTRINVQMFLVTTPFILALQYFGAEKDIFSFDRNPKTFSYAICVLFCALPVMTYALSLLNRSWDNLVRKLLGKTKTKSDDEERVVGERMSRSWA